MENSFRRSTMIPYHSAASRVFFKELREEYDFSIFQLSLSKILMEKIRRSERRTQRLFLLFYVSICRRIRKIIVLSLLSRLLEILQLFLRQFNFPTIPHQTLTDNNERFVLNCLIRSLKWKKSIDVPMQITDNPIVQNKTFAVNRVMLS